MIIKVVISAFSQFIQLHIKLSPTIIEIKWFLEETDSSIHIECYTMTQILLYLDTSLEQSAAQSVMSDFSKFIQETHLIPLNKHIKRYIEWECCVFSCMLWLSIVVSGFWVKACWLYYSMQMHMPKLFK